MKEALKTAAEALRIVYAEDAHVGNLSFMAHDALDSAIAAVEACLAQPEPEPVAWCVERVAPGMRDNGVRIGPWWRREDADAWADYEHKVVALYAGSAPTQSASPFAPCGRSAGTCGISSQTCGRDGCEADVVPADRLPKSQALDWSASVVAGAEQLAAVTAERDQLRDVANEPNLWRCTVCGRIGTVGRCCGENTREPM